jgi:hypothetical protein
MIENPADLFRMEEGVGPSCQEYAVNASNYSVKYPAWPTYRRSWIVLQKLPARLSAPMVKRDCRNALELPLR